MNFLAIDTTGEDLYVTLSKDGAPFYKKIETGKTGHSKVLMPAISEVLDGAGLDVNDIDVFATVVGPGSFTGIRIGVAAMTALSYAAGKKRVQVTSFELIAYNRKNITARVNAGHGNDYLAVCDNGKVLKTFFSESTGKIITCSGDCGSDGEKVFEGLQRFDKPENGIGETLFKTVEKKICNGEFSKVFEPFYMRKSQAERNLDVGNGND